MSIRRQTFASCEGFTLIEVIVVIGILAVVAGAMAPLATRMIDDSREELTRKRQQQIYRSIMGDPAAGGSGFLSDIGRLPNTSLTELSVRGTLPVYAYQACGVSMGWRGPYLLEGVDAGGRPLDGWGIPMDLVNGQIRSAGLDHNMTTAADNIVYPPVPMTANNLNGSIVLTVLALDSSTGQPTFVPAGGQATVCFAQNGQMQTVLLSSSSGTYVYPLGGSTLPQGIYAVTVTGDPDGSGPQPPLTRTVTTYCPGGGTVHQTVALR